MILDLPAKLDLNEWFVLGASAAAWAAALPLIRRLRPAMVLGLWLFNFFLAQAFDFVLAVKPLDLYDTMDRNEYEWFDLLLYTLTYPPVGILVGALPRRFRMGAARTAAFILAAAALTVGLEWIAHAAGVYHYRGWKLIYSYPCYIVSFALNVLFCAFIRRHLRA